MSQDERKTPPYGSKLSIATIDHWPPAAGVRAVQILKERLGQHESAPNQGPIVEWACRRWVSDEFWAKHYPAGKMAWCAGAVSSALSEAGVPMVGIGSVSCDALLRHMRSRGWDVWTPKDRLPSAGDVVFLGLPQDLRHVGLVVAVEKPILLYVSGNAGNAVRERTLPVDDDSLAWYVRVPG